MTEGWRIVVLLLAAGVLIEAVLLVAVMRQLGSLLLHVGPMKPEPFPGGPKVGELLTLPGNGKRPSMVLFTSAGCSICDGLRPGIRRIHADYRDQLDVVAIVTDKDAQERAEHAQKLGSFARTDLIALMQDWKIPGTPYAVALDSRHRVKGAGIINSADQLETLAVVALGGEPPVHEHTGNGASAPSVHHIDSHP